MIKLALERITLGGRVWLDGYIRLEEQPVEITGANVAADSVHLFAKDNGGGISRLFYKDDGQVEHEVVTSGSGGGGVTDHGALTGLADDDHAQYLLTADATSRALFAANWLDLTDAGATTLHSHAPFVLAIGSAITSATEGSVLFAGAGGILAQDNASLFFDDSSNELGVGTASPSGTLHVQSSTVNKELLILNNTNVTGGASVPFFMSSMSGGSQTNVSFENAGAGRYTVRTGATSIAGYGSQRQVIKEDGTVGLGGTITNDSTLAGAILVLNGSRAGFHTGSVALGQALDIQATNAGEGLLLYCTADFTDQSVPIFIAGDNGDGNASNASLELLTRGSTTPGDLIIRAGATSKSGFGSIGLSITGDKRNVILGGYNPSQPGTGTNGLILIDGTALATMASNTAGLYANDVGGTVQMYAINEAGVANQLSGDMVLGGTGDNAFTGGTGSGGSVILRSTTNATKGFIKFGDANTIVYDHENDRFGVGTATPAVKFHVAGFTPRFSALADGGILAYPANDANTVLNITNAAINVNWFTITAGQAFMNASNAMLAIGTTAFPGTGSAGLVFGDGTALSSMASNTAGIYANDVGGTVNMFAINEAGTVTQLTGGFNGTVTPVASITVVNGFVTAVS